MTPLSDYPLVVVIELPESRVAAETRMLVRMRTLALNTLAPLVLRAGFTKSVQVSCVESDICTSRYMHSRRLQIRVFRR